MGVRQSVGVALFSMSFLGLEILGVFIHLWTIIIAFAAKGFFASLLSFLLPVVSQIYWFFVIGGDTGYFDNWFCLSIMVYIGLWAAVFVGGALAVSNS